MRLIKEIILHCSATWSKQDIGAKEIRQWHIKGRGWRDIGYHYVIRRNGLIEPGRDLNEVGAHCTNHNASSIGICMVGGGPNGEDPYFTKEQFDSLALLVKFLRMRFPKATIYGHKEFANKACPVFSVPKFLDEYGIPKEGEK
jgi:hypothetical protein